MKRLPLFAMIVMIFLVQYLSVAQERPDALKLYREGRYEQALEVCKIELQELPKNMDSYTVMGWTLIALRRYEEAYNKAKEALSIAPYDHRVLGIAGEALFFLGKNREALLYFEQYAAIMPTGKRISNVYFFMGEVFIRLGEYNNADIAFSTALFYEDTDASWWARLGYSREMGQDYQWAKEAYENALKLNPNLVEARRGLESVSKKLSGG